MSKPEICSRVHIMPFCPSLSLICLDTRTHLLADMAGHMTATEMLLPLKLSLKISRRENEAALFIGDLSSDIQDYFPASSSM